LVVVLDADVLIGALDARTPTTLEPGSASRLGATAMSRASSALST
jgi:hypothetical protein